MIIKGNHIRTASPGEDIGGKPAEGTPTETGSGAESPLNEKKKGRLSHE